jgi:hypothetical protein
MSSVEQYLGRPYRLVLLHSTQDIEGGTDSREISGSSSSSSGNTIRSSSQSSRGSIRMSLSQCLNTVPGEGVYKAMVYAVHATLSGTGNYNSSLAMPGTLGGWGGAGQGANEDVLSCTSSSPSACLLPVQVQVEVDSNGVTLTSDLDISELKEPYLVVIDFYGS